MDGKNLKKYMIGQYIIIGLLVIICLFLIIDKKSDNKTSDQQSTKTTQTSDYDVSMMNKVTVKQALNLFKDKKSHLLYIGRETCGVCRKVLPTLQVAQNDLGYKTDYLDITSFSRDGEEWSQLEKLLDVKTTMTVTGESGKNEMVTNTFGYFIGNYGYTPSLIIIDNNKMVAGHIGNISLDDLTEWLQENGIG